MDKIRDLVADIEVAMLTTVGLDGGFRSRPMGTVLDPEAATLWLFVSAVSDTAAEVQRAPQVGLIFSDPQRDRYVAVSGEARFIEDRNRIHQLWREAFARWFPGGPDDKSLVLLEVDIAVAEFWDDSTKLMRTFFETIGAPYSGVPPEAVGEHARVRTR